MSFYTGKSRCNCEKYAVLVKGKYVRSALLLNCTPVGEGEVWVFMGLDFLVEKTAKNTPVSKIIPGAVCREFSSQRWCFGQRPSSPTLRAVKCLLC